MLMLCEYGLHEKRLRAVKFRSEQDFPVMVNDIFSSIVFFLKDEKLNPDIALLLRKPHRLWSVLKSGCGGEGVGKLWFLLETTSTS